MSTMLRQKAGKTLGRKRLRRLMKESGLQSTVRAKKYSDEVYSKRRAMKEALPPDLIHREFFALEPFKRLVEDITYLPCLEQTMYLNTIEDLFNGEIHAHRISEFVNAKLCTDTVEDLVEVIKATEGVILHGDHGSTYLSYAYRELVETKLHMRMSLGYKGSCYDNAAMSYEILIHAKDWPETASESFIPCRYFA